MRKPKTKHLDFITGDIIALGLANYLAIYMSMPGNQERGILNQYLQIGFLLIVLTVFVAFFSDGYKDVLRRGYLKEWSAVWKHMVMVASVGIIGIYIFQLDTIYSRSTFVLTFFFGGTFMYMERISLKRYLRWKFDKIRNAKSFMIITTSQQIEILLKQLKNWPVSIYKIVGIVIVDKDMTGQEIMGIPVKAGRAGVIEWACTQVVDEVLVSVPENPELEAELADQFVAIGVVVHVYMEQLFQNLPNRELEIISGMNVLTCANRVVPPWMLFVKRLMDWGGGIIGMIFTILIGIVVGPLIYIKSPGPILFTQTRVGKNGRLFKLYKFRSMYMDAEERKKELMQGNEMQGLMFKMKNDPRIIKGIGHFIRRTSLDEFPQFFNVIKGDMSLVGTRPPTVDEYERYKFHHKKRLCMKPGITGLWQISGRSNILNFEEVVKLDSEYIDTWDIEMDIKILIKTVCAIVRGHGAM